LLLACLLAVTARAGRAAEEAADAPLDRKTLDGIIYNNLRDVINRGADLYNNNQDYSGCYRLYEGALMALKPLLGHRPELQKAIGTGLASAEREPMMFRRAFVLREVIDRIRADIHPKPKEVVAKTLWDRLGGEAGVKKVVDDLVALAAKDPKVDFFRGGKYKPTPEEVDDLKKKVVDYISSKTGGPFKYEGKSMKEVHKGMGITDAQFDAFARDFQVALEKNKVEPADVKVLLAAVESTRQDIVEKKPDEKKPEDKEPKDKNPEGKNAAGAGSVRGVITVEGKPLEAGSITFYPAKGKGSLRSEVALGKYELKEVKPGKYTVTVQSAEKGITLPKKYSDPATSALEVDVQEGRNAVDLALNR
jgi:hemoglobin